MIAVGFLVSYDYYMLRLSLPLVYPFSDKIVLALEKNLKTFTGSLFQFDRTFEEWVKSIDIDHKIEWLEEEFYQEGKSPFEIVMRKRNRLLEVMAPADWFIQLDADEYFINFDGFTSYLNALTNQHQKLAVSVKWKTIFKKANNSYFMIAGRTERIQVATNYPYYTSERGNEATDNIDSDFCMLHQSWARSKAEIKTKVENWSHANDFDTRSFYDQWLRCNQSNYRKYINFHPIHNLLWPRLELVKAHSIPELMEHYTRHPPGEERPNPKPLWQKFKNRMKQLMGGRSADYLNS